MASARMIANGVQIWPIGSVNDLRHCASAVSARVGAGHAAQQALRRESAPADRRMRSVHRPLVLASVVIGSKAAVVARQAGEVRLVADLAAEDRAVDHVGVVDDRMNHRHLVLVAGEAQVIDRARVEEAAVADAGQIKLRDRFRRQAQERAQRVLVLGQPVVREEVVVRQQDAVPAPDPFVVERELALGVDAAAELAVAGLAGEGARDRAGRCRRRGSGRSR